MKRSWGTLGGGQTGGGQEDSGGSGSDSGSSAHTTSSEMKRELQRGRQSFLQCVALCGDEDVDDVTFLQLRRLLNPAVFNLRISITQLESRSEHV